MPTVPPDLTAIKPDLASHWSGPPRADWRLPASWHQYSAELHGRLLQRWRGILPPGTPILKTDLFEEAQADATPAARIADLGWRPLGMDLGAGIARAARARAPQLAAVVVADARRLPFRTASLPAIFSNSTLDHFHNLADLDAALAELHRVLAPGGRLLLTLDNPCNPLVGLRNALPAALTDRLRMTRYYVGRTLGPRAARARLLALGFQIEAAGTLMHAVRYLALRLLRRRERAGADAAPLLRRMLAMERLARWPSAPLTGHFIFLEAVKPCSNA